jgi:hypothetical protein
MRDWVRFGGMVGVWDMEFGGAEERMARVV